MVSQCSEADSMLSAEQWPAGVARLVGNREVFCLLSLFCLLILFCLLNFFCLLSPSFLLAFFCLLTFLCLLRLFLPAQPFCQTPSRGSDPEMAKSLLLSSSTVRLLGPTANSVKLFTSEASQTHMGQFPQGGNFGCFV